MGAQADEGSKRTSGRADERTGGQRSGGQAGGRADERTGVGTLGGRADGGGQWADGGGQWADGWTCRRRRAGMRTGRQGGRRADELADGRTGIRAERGGRVDDVFPKVKLLI